FLHQEREAWALRWFTPRVEVDLCGHATLASAHVLWETGAASHDAVLRFTTRSGVLTAARAGARIEMDFPATPPAPVEPPAGLLEALGAGARWVGRSRFDYLLEVETEAEVRGLAPDFTRLAAVEARGVIVTSRATTAPYDFVSRFFAPRGGVPEGPVTGSAHFALFPDWSAKLGKLALIPVPARRRGGGPALR